MITDLVRRDIFTANYSHICFAVNTQGYNAAGFAGQVSSRFWPELANTGPKQLGDTMTHVNYGRFYHALVCHSLDKNGWDSTPQDITRCLDALDLPEHSAIVLAGSGPVGQIQGADVYAILGGIARSSHKFIVFTR